MDELNSNNTSLPSLPVSLRSTFTSLSGGVRRVVRGYMLRVFEALWYFRPYVQPSSAPASFIFLLPGVLSSLECNISDVATLSAVFFLSEGGKRGVLSSDLVQIIRLTHPNRTLANLKHAGYVTRSHFDPSAPSRDKDHKFIQKRFVFITAEGVQVLKDLHGSFRSEFYGVINRAAFGPENCNKKPGPTNEPG